MNLHKARKIARSLSVKCNLCGKTIKSWTSDDMHNSYLEFLCNCHYEDEGFKHKQRLYYWPPSELIKKQLNNHGNIKSN